MVLPGANNYRQTTFWYPCPAGWSKYFFIFLWCAAAFAELRKRGPVQPRNGVKPGTPAPKCSCFTYFSDTKMRNRVAFFHVGFCQVIVVKGVRRKALLLWIWPEPCPQSSSPWNSLGPAWALPRTSPRKHGPSPGRRQPPWARPGPPLIRPLYTFAFSRRARAQFPEEFSEIFKNSKVGYPKKSRKNADNFLVP